MFLVLGRHNGLSYEYQEPASEEGYTFVCFNPLTGDKAMWEGGIGPQLIRQGHGLLTWNLRGQADSPFSPGEISQQSIVSDAVKLLEKITPQRPIFVGLSVGGLYAAQAHLAKDGYPCSGFVLINTLREIGPRLSWVNAALVRLVETGGLKLLRDAYLPLLMGENWQQSNSKDFMKEGGYTPIMQSDGAWHLLKTGESTTWDVDWADINVPVLNITGLQDQVFRNDKIIADLLTRFANVKALEYGDAGHMVPAETPDQLANDILQFAEQL
jgi:3-oxoadipate enol-lactonase